MTTSPPASIARGVKLLLRAMVEHSRGDAIALAAIRAELVILAGESEGFELQLTTALVERLAKALPRASRADIENAVAVDIRRHVSTPVRLAAAKPQGHA